jgi:hypothetical protein
MRAFVSTLVLTAILFGSCKDRSASENKEEKTGKVQDTLMKPVQDTSTNFRSPGPGWRVSAYLIYSDGTLSSFDVLNDHTIALWNVPAGGGDAGKPSDSIKIRLSGDLDNLVIKVTNGHETAIDKTITHADKDIEYVVKNTGCNEVYVNVTRNKKPVYNDTIPFHCGE